MEEDLLKLTDELQQEAQCIPNITHPDVPIGGEDSSSIRKTVFPFHSVRLIRRKKNIYILVMLCFVG